MKHLQMRAHRPKHYHRTLPCILYHALLSLCLACSQESRTAMTIHSRLYNASARQQWEPKSSCRVLTQHRSHSHKTMKASNLIEASASLTSPPRGREARAEGVRGRAVYILAPCTRKEAVDSAHPSKPDGSGASWRLRHTQTVEPPVPPHERVKGEE